MNSIRNLTGILSAIEFPATRDQVLRLAKSDNVDRRISRWLEDLPDGSYAGVWEICQALASGETPKTVAERALAGATH